MFHSSAIRQKLDSDLVSSDHGGDCLPQDDGWLPVDAFLLFMVRLVFPTMSLQILRLSSDISSSKVSPS